MAAGPAVRLSERMGPATITPLDGSDEAISAWVAVQQACRLADAPDTALPSAARVRGDLEHPWPGTRIDQWAARLAGRTIGVLTIGMRLTDNTDVTVIRELRVHPDHRRRGIGTLLWRHAIAQSRATGRYRLLVETTRTIDCEVEPGELFVTRMGAKRVTRETGRRLAVDQLDDADLRRRLADAEAASTDYSLLQWVGGTPADHVDGMAMLAARMTTDVPLDDLDWEPEAWDAERVQARDAVMAARGNRSYTTAARHDPTGELAGYTVLDFLAGNDEYGWQQDTLVLPAHRGRRLGLRLKVENLSHVRSHEPNLRFVDTRNADANDHMIAINEALGFRPVKRHSEWELTIEEAS